MTTTAASRRKTPVWAKVLLYTNIITAIDPSITLEFVYAD